MTLPCPGFRPFKQVYLECITGIPGLELELVALAGLGRDTRMGKIMDTPIMPAIT